MKAAQAKRKIIVFGEISDVRPSKRSERTRKLRYRAQEIADITIFVGPWASSVSRRASLEERRHLRAFTHVRDAAEYINSITCEGDLVLLKGTNRQDHLQRIILARNEEVACWREDCDRVSFCNECPDLNKPSGAPLLLKPKSLQRRRLKDPAIRPSPFSKPTNR